MGRRGPKPEAPEVRSQKAAVRSTRKPRQRATSDETSAAGSISAPAWLKGEGLTIWRRLAPRLRAAKLLTAVDRETFARYCRNFARWHRLQQVLDEEGETYETETYIGAEEGSGQAGRANRLKRAHPAFMIADRLERQLLAAEDRFGLNPAERQRIFVARAATGVTGDLFDQPTRRPGDPAAEATQPAQPDDSPIGMLN